MSGTHRPFFNGALSLMLLCACEVDREPATVADLRVASVSGTTVTLEWTQVDDGTGQPADYLVGFGEPPIKWDSTLATSATIDGSSVSAPISYAVDNLRPGTTYSFQVASFRELGDGSQLVSGPSRTATATTLTDDPGAIEDVSVFSTTSTSVTVRWTQVTDGVGGVANYAVGIGSPTINWSTAVGSAAFVAGNQVGDQKSYTFSGLTPSTTYQIQVASLRGDAVATGSLGPLSNIVTVATSAPPPAPTPGAFFTDNFDSGSRVSANGFLWKSTGSRVVVSSERAFSGQYSLRFRYGPDTTDQDSNAEQRFDLGRNVPGIWIEFMLFVPTNFQHRAQASSVNNKFFMIWNQTYGSGSGTWQAGYEYNRSTDSTSSIRPMSSKEFGTNASFVTSSGLGHPDQGKAFIGAANPLKPGQWHRVRFQFQRSSAGGASDGIMRFWIDDAMFAQMTNGPFRNLDNVGETVLRNGYFLGWSNSGFTEPTDWFIDDVRFYESDPGWTP